VGDRSKQSFIEQLIAQTPVEAFDKSVLLRFAGCDVVPVDPGSIGPLQDGVGRVFRAVVADDDVRAMPSLADDAVQLPRNALAGERAVRHQRQTLAGAVIDDGQDAEPPPVRQLV
jgi:hypothetical protein